MHDSYLNSITISQAEVNQLPLLKRFFKSNGFRAQAAKSDMIFYAQHKNIIVCALRLCQYGDSWLLRSMCVKSDYQRQGVGRHFLHNISAHLQSTACYCFPYEHLEKFYSEAGFSQIEASLSDNRISTLFKNYRSRGKNILLMKYTD